MAIRSVADNLNLGFFPYQDEEYDFVISNASMTKPAVAAFLEILKNPAIQQVLAEMGLLVQNR